MIPGTWAKNPFTGSNTQTINLSQAANGMHFVNDGASDATLTINSLVFTVKPGETFDEWLEPFSSFTVTATTAYHGLVRG